MSTGNDSSRDTVLQGTLDLLGRKHLTIETGRWNRLAKSIARVMDPGPTPENA
jgi:PadR family transcriptional regulator